MLKDQGEDKKQLNLQLMSMPRTRKKQPTKEGDSYFLPSIGVVQKSGNFVPERGKKHQGFCINVVHMHLCQNL